MIDLDNHKHSNILKHIYINNHLHHDCLKLDFYEKRQIVHIYDEIFKCTDILNEYDVSLRERIYYIENDLEEVQICKYCKTNKLKFAFNTVRLDNSCKLDECKKKHRTFIANQTKRDKLLVSNMCVGCKNEFFTRPCERQKYCCRSCYTKNKEKYSHSPETKQKISITNKLVHNSVEFRQKMKLVRDNSNYKIKQSETMKRLIQEGKFTPCITNSWTHWDAKIELEDGSNRKFRSSWEACFWLYNQHLDYEKVRIPYKFQDSWKNYIVDFVNFESKELFEIKPNSCLNDDQNLAKVKAAMEWCKENQFKFTIIGDEWFKNNINLNDFPKNRKLIEMVLGGIGD